MRDEHADLDYMRGGRAADSLEPAPFSRFPPVRARSFSVKVTGCACVVRVQAWPLISWRKGVGMCSVRPTAPFQQRDWPPLLRREARGPLCYYGKASGPLTVCPVCAGNAALSLPEHLFQRRRHHRFWMRLSKGIAHAACVTVYSSCSSYCISLAYAQI